MAIPAPSHPPPSHWHLSVVCVFIVVRGLAMADAAAQRQREQRRSTYNDNSFTLAHNNNKGSQRGEGGWGGT